MARPQKSGLEYFPLDVDIDNDEKVAYVISRHGFQAFGLLIKILMNIYRDGYYMMWTERQQYLFSFKLNVDIEYAKTVVSAYINEGFFNKKVYENYNVLTSHGIQIRYLQAVGRRAQIKIANEYRLFTTAESAKLGNVDFYSINVDNNGVNVSNKQAETEENATESTQSKVKNIDDDDDRKVGDSDSDFGEIITSFSNNIHPVSGQIECEMLGELLECYGKVWVLEAIKETVSYHGTSIQYVKKILSDWERRGFKAEKPKQTQYRRQASSSQPSLPRGLQELADIMQGDDKDD